MRRRSLSDEEEREDVEAASTTRFNALERWELDYERLRVVEKVGAGSAGHVYKGEYLGATVSRQRTAFVGNFTVGVLRRMGGDWCTRLSRVSTIDGVLRKSRARGRRDGDVPFPSLLRYVQITATGNVP